MDHVTKVTFDVLLSYPNQTDLSRIYLLDSNDTVIYATQEVEKVLSPDQNRSDVVPPFNAYAKSADVQVTYSQKVYNIQKKYDTDN